jgi:hypothetical protein
LVDLDVDGIVGLNVSYIIRKWFFSFHKRSAVSLSSEPQLTSQDQESMFRSQAVLFIIYQIFASHSQEICYCAWKVMFYLRYNQAVTLTEQYAKGFIRDLSYWIGFNKNPTRALRHCCT